MLLAECVLVLPAAKRGFQVVALLRVLFGDVSGHLVLVVAYDEFITFIILALPRTHSFGPQGVHVGLHIEWVAQGVKGADVALGQHLVDDVVARRLV